ncbi:MAG: CRISPR-associated endonuclease Cas2 [Bryobacteraceae bacterium]|nr:CRISPR-associated endonuclease Cas2 [Bryobacteraceae bacterium]
MAKRNRYAGVLRPVQVGQGRPESALLVLYDIEDDRLRTRVSNVCLDYGLERIQFSAFMGKLSKNHREELQLRLRNEIGTMLARVRVIPVCAADFEAMWTMDQYCLPEEAEERAARPVLRIVAAD